ncbi:MAG TPA: FecR domain-containing protein, partial [Candidatus Hydrogenedentes bacterium]|nr:FecR domain-containing protein [Candidatus Hydrogenedentota bacterium]
MKERIAAIADGSIDDHDRKAVMDHVEHCDTCRLELERMRETVGVIHRAFSRGRLVADLTSRVMMYLPEMEPELPACGHESAPGRAETSGYLWALVAGVAAALLLVAGLTWLTWPDSGEQPIASWNRPETAGVILGLTKGITAVGKDGNVPIRVAKASYALEKGARYETGTGEAAVLGLRDGSRVSLFEQSSLTIFGDREIMLNSGRACFEVTHNGERFRVKSPDGLVTVMGTTFGVAVEQGRTVVTVISGMVQVENSSSFVLLTQDEQTEMGMAVTTL